MENRIYFSKDINDDVLDNYIIETYDSGITCLLFNTKNRWIDFHRSTNDTYHFSIDSSWNGDKIEENTYVLKICGEAGDYLNYISKNIVTKVQEKDQISFYFIPYELITNNKKMKEMAIKQREHNNESLMMKVLKHDVVYVDGETIKDRYNKTDSKLKLSDLTISKYDIIREYQDGEEARVMVLESKKII
jgi:hypothetical protein